MAAASGNGGVLQVSATGTTAFTAIASLQSWSLERSAEAIETSEMGTSTAKTFISGQTSFSGSAEAFWNDDQVAGQEAIETALTGNDNTFQIKLYPVGTSSGDYWSGGIIITGVSFSASLNSPVGFSFTFQGTGDLTHNDA
jgi:predicted secreted protein